MKKLLVSLFLIGLIGCEYDDPNVTYTLKYVVFYPNYNDTIIDTIPYEYHREVYNGYEIITDDKYQETNNLYKGVAPCKIVSQEKIAK